MRTEDVLAALHKIAEAPWSDWYSHALTARGLARLLKPYGIRPKVLRIGDSTRRGYDRDDFVDAWSRYTVRNIRNSATDHPEAAGQGYVADAENHAQRNPQHGLDLDFPAESCGVADVADTPPEPDHEDPES
jgi:hypothetical protein